MKRGRLLVWDTETTGLTVHPDAPLDRQPRPIEFAAVTIDVAKGDVVEKFSTLINPQVPISEEITRITKLTDDDVADQRTFEQALPAIADCFRSADVDFAHNRPFDAAIINYAVARLPAPPDRFPWPRRGFCTVEWFAWEWGRRMRLIELYERTMGAKYAQTHRALDDCSALAEVLIAKRVWEAL